MCHYHITLAAKKEWLFSTRSGGSEMSLVFFVRMLLLGQFLNGAHFVGVAKCYEPLNERCFVSIGDLQQVMELNINGKHVVLFQRPN